MKRFVFKWCSGVEALLQLLVIATITNTKGSIFSSLPLSYSNMQKSKNRYHSIIVFVHFILVTSYDMIQTFLLQFFLLCLFTSGSNTLCSIGQYRFNIPELTSLSNVIRTFYTNQNKILINWVIIMNNIQICQNNFKCKSNFSIDKQLRSINLK